MQYKQPSPTDRSRYATAAGDRSKHCRSVAPWPNRNKSYDPEIVRSGVTLALLRPLEIVLSLRNDAKLLQDRKVRILL